LVNVPFLLCDVKLGHFSTPHESPINRSVSRNWGTPKKHGFPEEHMKET
jgi:hypothetical protein